MIKIEGDGLVGGSMFGGAEGVVEDCSRSSLSGKTSTTSSIGNNSGLSEEEENEVQSGFNGACMEALEEVLPIRKGISKFYNGKSKSFASLSDISCSPSIKDIAKRDDAYSRKRRNLLAYNLWGKSESFLHQSNGAGRISKRAISSSQSKLALGVSMSSPESLSSRSEDSNWSWVSKSPSSLPSTPKSLSSWRSYSLADLQNCASASTSRLKRSSVCDKV